MKDDETPSYVTAGFPNAARDSTDVPLDLNDYLITHSTSTFFMRVLGSQLVSHGVLSDDLLIVDKAREPAANDLVVISVNGELQVRQFKKARNGSTFISDGEKPLVVTVDLDFAIWGVVISVIRKLY